MSWCNLPSPHFSFFLHEPTIPLGRVQKNPSLQTLSCASRVMCPHPHPLTTGSGISSHTGTSSLLTEERTDPDFTDRQNLIKSAWQSCSIVICTLSFNWPWQKYCYTVGLVTYLAPPCFHVSNYLMSVVFIQFHYLLIQIFLQYNVEWRTRKKKKNHRWWENAGKKQNAVNSQKKGRENVNRVCKCIQFVA